MKVIKSLPCMVMISGYKSPLYTKALEGWNTYSFSIHCSSCLRTTHKKGNVSYSHKVLQAAIMHPDMRQVIPLMPEEIRNTDGTIKQDCEINAAKRLIPAIKKDHPQSGLIIVGDDLFSRGPFIKDVLATGYHYIFTVKADSHKYLMDWIDAYDNEDINELRTTDKKGRIHVYQWFNNVPLYGSADSIEVNFFQYKIISKDKNGNEKINYKSSWVTDLQITE
ncbi:MAG TPA: hypothetical protein ENG83_00475, partial [Nitrospirae bacterium]|nr:hypothetical protein [Nitrospirota bacterium]